MSSPFNADIEPCNTDNSARITVGLNARRQTMSLDKLHRYSKVFEKKLQNAQLKKTRIPFKEKKQEETSEECSQNPIDAQLAAFLPMKYSPVSSEPGHPVQNLTEPRYSAADINLSASWTTSPETSCISSLKNTVIIFGFLSKLEAHIENSGNAIIVNWVARTKKSYSFMKDKLGRFGKSLERRLNGKIATCVRYKK